MKLTSKDCQNSAKFESAMLDGVETWPAPRTSTSHVPITPAALARDSSLVTSTTWDEVETDEGSAAAVSFSDASVRPSKAMRAAPAAANAVAVSRPMPLPFWTHTD